MFEENLSAQNKGMHSVASPVDRIEFDRAAAIWFAFYARLFNLNPETMRSADIQDVLERLCDLFPVRFNWTSYNAARDEWRTIQLPVK